MNEQFKMLLENLGGKLELGKPVPPCTCLLHYLLSLLQTSYVNRG